MWAASRLNPRFQVTIPAEIRDLLGLRPGDTVIFESRDGQVVLHKAIPSGPAWHQALETTLQEWDGPEDEAAYGSLQGEAR